MGELRPGQLKKYRKAGVIFDRFVQMYNRYGLECYPKLEECILYIDYALRTLEGTEASKEIAGKLYRTECLLADLLEKSAEEQIGSCEDKRRMATLRESIKSGRDMLEKRRRLLNKTYSADIPASQ